MNLLELAVKIVMDDSEVDKGFDEVENKASSFSDKMGKVGKGLATAGAIGAGVAVATAKVSQAFVSGVGNVAEYGDNIDKMSQKMGISAQAYQEWDAIMQHSGTSIEALKPSMKTLANAAEKGNDAFQKLGISEQEVASLSQEDLFAKVISGLQGMEEGTERTYITSQLLGRGATELGALLNTSAEETEAMRQRVHELGGVMSDEAVKDAAAFQDQLQDMQTGFQSLSRNMLSEFLPTITTVMGGLTDLFTGNYDEGIEKISEGLNNIVSGLAERLPDMLEVGVRILENLAQAILQNIPTILPALVDMVLSLVQVIIENLPMLIDVGIQIIFALIDGITNAIPDLIPAIVAAITTIITKLTEPATLMQLIQAAFQLLGALAQGILEAIPELVKAVPDIIQNFIEAIIMLLPQILASGAQMIAELALGMISALVKIADVVVQIKSTMSDRFLKMQEDFRKWGSDMITNFINGLKQKWGDLKKSVSDMAGTVKSYLHFSEPDVGPLSDFSTYAPDMMELFADGIKDNTKLVTDQINKSFDFSQDIIKPENNNALLNSNIPKSSNTAVNSASNVQVNVTLEGVASEILRVVRQETKKMYNSTGNDVVVYGG